MRKMRKMILISKNKNRKVIGEKQDTDTSFSKYITILPEQRSEKAKEETGNNASEKQAENLSDSL